MNILEFIDSPDIREYNKNTDFTPAEQVAIICDSQRTSIGYKIDALTEIVNKYKTDEEYDLNSIDKHNFYVTEEQKNVSFRDTIINTINTWKRLLSGEQLLDNKTVYEIVYGDYFDTRIDRDMMLATFDGVKKFIANQDDEDAYDYTIVIQTYIDDNGSWYGDKYIFIGKSLTCININDAYLENSGLFAGDLTKLYYVLLYGFHKGDIVKCINVDHSYYGVCTHDDYSSKAEDIYFKNGYEWEGTRKTSLDTFISNHGFDYTDDTPIVRLEKADVTELEDADIVLLAISEIYKGEASINEIMWVSDNNINKLPEVVREHYEKIRRKQNET